MSPFIRFPLLGCLALLATACGSSGSQTVLGGASNLSPEATTGGFTSVEYLLKDGSAITAARGKFTGATAPTANAITLNSRRGTILNGANRYLSSGALVTRTTGTNAFTTDNFVVVGTGSCSDETGATKAKCDFGADELRDMVTFHLGSTNSGGGNRGFRSFSAARQPVMDYRDVKMSQVRTTGTDTKGSGESATKNYDYVGYDGMLQYSMFFVGVYKFFDSSTPRALQHIRLENASFGRIYDRDTTTDAIDNPNVDLTGTGVMAGVETKNGTLEHHLVQGDVAISFTTSNNQIDITTTNVKRLVGSGTAWFANQTRQDMLKWLDLSVTNSKFSGGGVDGSIYGTGSNYEVGGTFYETHGGYSIVGSFGSTLAP